VIYELLLVIQSGPFYWVFSFNYSFN